tara:strand:- start:261 stop:992 length:732 start_codon:yes stop_codon:yes gene_type:complete
MGKQNNYIVCLDWETGGLDPQKNAVTQIGMEVLDPVTLKSIASYSSYIKPYPKKDVTKGKIKKLAKRESSEDTYVYDQKALDYTNVTMELLEEKGQDIKVVMEEMLEIFKLANPTNARNYKPVILGQNITFDIGFLQHIFSYCGEKMDKYLNCNKDFFGNQQPIYFDTLYLAKQYYAENDKFTSHKLGLLSDDLGIELVNAHSAEADVQATSGIFRLFIKNMRSSGDSETDDFAERARDHFKF